MGGAVVTAVRYMVYVKGDLDVAFRFNACFEELLRAYSEVRWYEQRGYSCALVSMPDGMHKYSAIVETAGPKEAA